VLTTRAYCVCVIVGLRRIGGLCFVTPFGRVCVCLFVHVLCVSGGGGRRRKKTDTSEGWRVRWWRLSRVLGGVDQSIHPFVVCVVFVVVVFSAIDPDRVTAAATSNQAQPCSPNAAQGTTTHTHNTKTYSPYTHIHTKAHPPYTTQHHTTRNTPTAQRNTHK
jgi:hypothetical protein